MKRCGWYLVLIVSMAGLPTMAQTPDAGKAASNDTAAPAAKTATTSAPAKKPEDAQAPKKVWTNDNVGALKGSISVVGAKPLAHADEDDAENEQRPDSNPRRGRIQQYRDAIANLRTQIEDTDGRISKLKNFKAQNGSPSGGIDPNKAYDMVPLEEQVKQLEGRKKQLQGKIEELENRARKDGIEPGELR